MEVVQRTDDGPFGRRDVEEWSRLDELTGMLEHARVQTDRWAGVDSLGGSHKYGKKVVDATKTGGAGQHRQRQQLEVFQSRVPGGALQVIRTQSASCWSNQGNVRPNTTVSSSSSHTRWSSRSTTGGSTIQESEPAENFANLQLALNPIDVSSLKMKACVGRSGSIGGRRPPSTRSRRLSASGAVNEEEASTLQEDEEEVPSPPSQHLNELSRLCLQVHEEQKRRYDMSDEEEVKFSFPLARRFSKSSSTDDIPAEIVARDEKDEGMSSWRRGARVRRSLQFSSRDGDKSSGVCVPVPATKRHSFVTVESLKEVRGRLRHLTSDQVVKSGKRNGVLMIPDYRSRVDDDNDDGIASEETAIESDSPLNTLRSSVPAQTGSLESRSSRVSAATRSDEWFNRRKSYGFEQVHSQSTERSITDGRKTDSADSGISRSTETVPLSSANNDVTRSNNDDTEEQSRKKTVVTLNAMSNKWSEKNAGDMSPTRRRFSESSAFFKNVTSEAQTAARRASAAPKPTTITIPIIFQQDESTERKRFSLRTIPDTSRALTNGHSSPPPPDPETLGWASRRQLDGLGPAKRRSWAGDSSLFSQDVHSSDCDDQLTKSNTTHTIITQDDMEDETTSNTAHNKKTKRVEFCKTEVHFAAESGRFHIIETDEKPPPSNNFRRRRRSQPATNNTTAPVVAQKPPLPELRFGDSIYEKKMLMSNAPPSENKEITLPIEMEDSEKGEDEHIYAVANTKIVSSDVSSEDSGRNTDTEDNRHRSIFKKLSSDDVETSSDKEETRVWGVKLKPVSISTTPAPANPTPVWRSTVTLKNNDDSSPGQMELQKLLRSLRPANSSSSPQRRSLDLSNERASPETWSVAERIRLAEERKARGFSTKVKLGGAGETTVLESSSEPVSWHSSDKHPSDSNKETGGQLRNSRLVVRIGNGIKKDDGELINGHSSISPIIINNSVSSEHCSSPKYRPEAVRRASTGVLKSPSLIMQTINCRAFSPARELPRISLPELGVPGQLAALRQLYEAAGEDDDSDAADREVSALMSPEDPNPPPRQSKQISPCGGSVVSGSWSKMRAVRLSQQFHKYQPPTQETKPEGFVRLKPPSESTSPLIRPVPRTRRRAALLQNAQKEASKEENHNVSNKTGPNEPPVTSSVQTTAATFTVPSYTESRLRSVDTLVSTRGGGPRITSISLRYEGEPEQPKVASPTKSVTAISAAPRRASSPSTGWTSPLKPTRRPTSPSRPTFSSRLSTSPIKQEVTEPAYKVSVQARSSPSKVLPQRVVSPVRGPASPAATRRSPQGISSTKRAISPSSKKTSPPQTFFGAEVLEVEPRPEDRRREDEIVPCRSVEQTSSQRVTSYRSSSRSRIVDSNKPRVEEHNRARSLSPVKRLNKLVVGENPIYQNQAAISASKLSPPPERQSKSSAALIEELTRAADEILQAVNGYSDESAASSDDEKPAPRLSALREGEISEERTPARKKTTTATNRLKKKVNGPNSSTSSIESLSKETRSHQRPALPCVRAQRPAVPLPGSPSMARASSSDEGHGSGRRQQRVTRRRPALHSSPKPERATKEELESSKTRERAEARAARSSRPRRTRTATSARHVEETVACSKRVLAPDLSKVRTPVERIIPAAPRKSPAKTRKEELHQLNRTANGATAERRLLLIEAGASSSARVCGNSGSVLTGRVKPRGDPLKVAAK